MTRVAWLELGTFTKAKRTSSKFPLIVHTKFKGAGDNYYGVADKFRTHFYGTGDKDYPDDGLVFQQIILNYPEHVKGFHQKCPHGCPHHGTTHKAGVQLLPEWSKEVDEFFKFIKKKYTLRVCKKYTRGRYTSTVESFNHFLLYYRPKLVHFRTSELARCYCAALDWNSKLNHIHRSCVLAGTEGGNTLEAVSAHRGAWRERVLLNICDRPVVQ